MRGYRATRSYVWTAEQLFTASDAAIYDLDTADAWLSVWHLEVGGNTADVDVLLLLLCELSEALDGLALRLLQIPPAEGDAGSEGCGVAAGREDPLLAAVGPALEEGRPAVLDAYLRRWGVGEHEYHEALAGRLWLRSAEVVVVPAGQMAESAVACAARVAAGLRKAQWPSVPELTSEVQRWALRVEAAMAESWHTPVVAVPPLMGLFLRQLPRPLLHEGLLYHSVNNALCIAPGTSGQQQEQSSTSVVPASYWRAPVGRRLGAMEALSIAEEESRELSSLGAQYEELLTQRRYVRVALPCLPRYLFVLILCCGLPSLLRQRLAKAYRAGAAADVADVEDAGATVEEVLLGVTVSWALLRWQRYLRSNPLSFPVTAAHRVHQRAVVVRRIYQECVTELHRRLPSCTAMAGGTALRSLQRRLGRPYPTEYRGSSLGWVLRYVRDAEVDLDEPTQELQTGRAEGSHGDAAAARMEALDAYLQLDGNAEESASESGASVEDSDPRMADCESDTDVRCEVERLFKEDLGLPLSGGGGTTVHERVATRFVTSLNAGMLQHTLVMLSNEGRQVLEAGR